MEGHDERALRNLRDELDANDRAILGLAAERLRIVERIRSAKQRMGKHVFDRAREQEVYERAESRAEELGMDRSVARALMMTLVEASVALQERAAADVDASERRRVLIVGGQGRMGQLFGRLLTERGHAIAVLDKDDPIDSERIGASDVVMIAVPMTEAAAVTRAVAPHVSPDGLLCDINSLKSEVCEAMRTCPGEAIGTHPMFGPTVRSLRRQKVVLCDVKPGERTNWLAAELGRMGADIVVTSPQVHDKAMAVVQVLTHFGIMAMGCALASSGLTVADTLEFTSPIYRLELAMVGRLFSQKPELYQEILMTNPHAASIRQAYLREANRLATTLETSDRQRFHDTFNDTAAYFASFKKEAMTLSDHLIQSIIALPHQG